MMMQASFINSFIILSGRGRVKKLPLRYFSNATASPQGEGRLLTAVHQLSHGLGIQTARFLLQAEKISSLSEPAEFLQALHDGITVTQGRLTLSALYFGTGKLERHLTQRIVEACRRRPALQVHILLDHSRAFRGKAKNSVTMILPLLKCFPHQIKLSLFHMPQLRGPLRYLPSPLNEVVAVSHLKAMVMDDDLILTGANLSHDYFTQRQDRYVSIKNAGGLALFYHELVELLGKHSVTIQPDGEERPPLLQGYRSLPQELLQHLTNPSFFPPGSPSSSKADTWAIPTLQLATLGVRHEEALLRLLLNSSFFFSPPSSYSSSINNNSNSNNSSCNSSDSISSSSSSTSRASSALPFSLSTSPSQSSSTMEMTMATAYLNPTPSFQDLFTSWPGRKRVIGPSQATHGFSGATGAKAWIPSAYALLEAKLLQHLKKGSSQNEFYRYVREGWTFHGKGLWMMPSQQEGDKPSFVHPSSSSSSSSSSSLPQQQNHKQQQGQRWGQGGGGEEESPLMVTVAGSSNYGYRSFERDLESQVILLSTNPHLTQHFRQEYQRLLDHCLPVDLIKQEGQQFIATTGSSETDPTITPAGGSGLVGERIWVPPLTQVAKGLL